MKTSFGRGRATYRLTCLLGAALAGAGLGAQKPAGDTTPFHKPIRLTAADGFIDSGAYWGHSGPCVFDVDGDGKRDLLVGDFSGKFRFYRNLGTNKEPRYAAPTVLMAGGVEAQVPIY